LATLAVVRPGTGVVREDLVASKGSVGIEVTVWLGGSQAADTAAEVRLARQVLAKLRG
jgi:hypothetical protein